MAEKMARRRVKLYALNPERQWDDRGTGHVTSTYVDRLKGMSLLVRAETDGTPLLESKIQTDTAYQKQQGTLIVWSEGESFDLALSFQEKAGCDEIWEKICQVQGKDPSVDITQEVVDESEEERFEEANDSSSLWVELPPCELAKLDVISELIASSLYNVSRQDKVANTIENEAYIKKLLDLFRLCEDLDNTESLHTLYEIFKNIFLLNKNSLLEVLFADENIFDVVGALEYDPTSPYPKKHRDFLKSLSKFKEVIPLENNELVNKIHQTFRVQYIQDVALPNQAVYEENMPSTLSSFIFFNKVEIVSMIQEDERFLSELFLQLGSEDVSVEKRRDLILFLKEFCTFSQTLQPPNRENFYKTLSSFGVLGALECTLAIDEPIIKAASVDVLGFFVEFSPSMVRDYMLQQQHKVEEEHYLLNIMLEQMVVDCDPEMGGAVQLMGILRILIDPENMLATHNKAERADFLAFFYKHSMHYLIAPLVSNTAGDVVVREDYQTAQLVALILELLAFCVEHHSYHIKNYIIHRDLLRRVMVLMKSKHTFLVLSAVRFIRKIVGMRDEFYNRHIISCNLFAPIVDTYVKNNSRYNLLDSAILEIFEYIKSEDIKSLTIYSMEKFGDVFNRIEYVQTFITLRTRFNQHQDKIRDKEKSTAAVESLGLVRSNATGNGTRFRRDIREMESEEERWFNTDDCEEDFHSPLKQELLKGAGSVVGSALEDEEEEEEEGTLLESGNNTPPSHRLTAAPILLADEKLSKEEPESEESLQVSGGSPTSSGSDTPEDDDKNMQHSPSSGISLVDYDENSDEEEEDDEIMDSCSVAEKLSVSMSRAATSDKSGVVTDTRDDAAEHATEGGSSSSGSPRPDDTAPMEEEEEEEDSSSVDATGENTSQTAADDDHVVATSTSSEKPVEKESLIDDSDKMENGEAEEKPQHKGSQEDKESKDVDDKPREAGSSKQSDHCANKSKLPSEDSQEVSNNSECKKVITQNGERKTTLKTEISDKSKEHSTTNEGSETDDSNCKKDNEQEKKRERSVDDMSGSQATELSAESNKCSNKSVEKCSSKNTNSSDDVSASVDGAADAGQESKESGASNGLAESDKLAEGESLRKRPRLEVD